MTDIDTSPRSPRTSRVATGKKRDRRRRHLRPIIAAERDPESFINVFEAAEFLGVSPDTVRRGYRRHFVKLGAMRVGLKFKFILNPDVT